MAEKAIRYRCLAAKTCGHEFDLGPRPKAAGHEVTDGACPVCGGRAGELRWYVVQAVPKAEAGVADRLRKLKLEALFLHYLVPVMRADRFSQSRRRKATIEPKIVKRPVLPGGYVFVRIVAAVDTGRVAALPNVLLLLGSQSGPLPVSDGDIERLRKGADKDGVVPIDGPQDARRAPLKVGSIVRILSGPFGPGLYSEGFEGPVVQDDGRGFLKVEITIFGRPTPVDVPYAGVEVIAEAA
jgi:transcriptional antiterminator NusG